jgi:hypothetical protein
MITNFKTFENVKDEPEIGDYVICHIVEEFDSEKYQEDTDEFLNNNIGIIIDIYQERYVADSITKYNIKFDNSPNYNNDSQLCQAFDTNTNTLYFYADEIDFWSKSKEEVILMRDTKKYNL